MNKLFIIALLTLTGMSNAMAQQEVALEEKVYEVVEEMPSFPGGQGAMFEFIANNIQYHYCPLKSINNSLKHA